MLSVCLCPKVITLSGFHCMSSIIFDCIASPKWVVTCNALGLPLVFNYPKVITLSSNLEKKLLNLTGTSSKSIFIIFLFVKFLDHQCKTCCPRAFFACQGFLNSWSKFYFGKTRPKNLCCSIKIYKGSIFFARRYFLPLQNLPA